MKKTLAVTESETLEVKVNGLIIRALLQYCAYYGDTFTVECPTGSGRKMTTPAQLLELGKIAGVTEVTAGARSVDLKAGQAPRVRR